RRWPQEVEIMKRESVIMNSTDLILFWQRLLAAVTTTALLLLAILIIASRASGQVTAGNNLKGKAFTSAQQAAEALIDAAEKYDETALNEVLGPDSYDITHTGEPARDSEKVKACAAQARTKMSVDL